jgi:hypothetical protein
MGVIKRMGTGNGESEIRKEGLEESKEIQEEREM